MIHNSLFNIRKKEGLTQEEFANKLGVTLSHYSKIEVSSRNPSYNFLKKFKKAFPNESIDDIFFESHIHKVCG